MRGAFCAQLPAARGPAAGTALSVLSGSFENLNVNVPAQRDRNAQLLLGTQAASPSLICTLSGLVHLQRVFSDHPVTLGLSGPPPLNTVHSTGSAEGNPSCLGLSTGAWHSGWEEKLWGALCAL